MLSVSLTALLAVLAVAGSEPTSSITAGSRGIRKVIDLLTEMQATVEKEAKADKASYDEYKCWCETNEAEKTKAVEDSNQKIAGLEAFLEEAAGLSAQLKTEIAGLEADIQEDQDALATATSQREKENAEFAQAESDLKECLAALKEAVAVLSKVQLLQKKGPIPAAVKAEARASLLELQRQAQKSSPMTERFRDVMQKDLFDALSSIDSSKPGKFLAAISQQSRLTQGGEPDRSGWDEKKLTEGGFDGVGEQYSDEEKGKMARPNGRHGAAAGAKSYNSRSGQILGVLGGMSDAFKRDLGSAQKAELEALINYNHLKASKLAEIAAATKAKNGKEAALADLEVKVARSKDELGETKDFLAQNEKFLVDMAEMCKTADEEYAGRCKIRNEELRALSEVLKILTSDEVRDLYAKTMDFLQVDMDQKAKAQRLAIDKAMQKVLGVARKNKDWMLISLATRAQLDQFAKVKELMDKMLAELKAQQKAEYEKEALCRKQLDENEDQTKAATKVKNELETRKLGLENEIERLEAEIESLHTDIAETLRNLKKAGEDRKAENEAFQEAVADQRATVQILKKAQNRLQDFYHEKALLQTKKITPAHMSAPTKPAEYRKGENAGGIMQLLDKVISEAEQAESVLVIDEQHSQANYAKYAADADASVAANRAAIASNEKAKAEAEGNLSETKEALLTNAAELTNLADVLSAIHADCDFLLKYFDIRQQARTEEMDSIVNAKAILSGADFGAAA